MSSLLDFFDSEPNKPVTIDSNNLDKVIDGDTIKLKGDEKGIRLNTVDAPELPQFDVEQPELGLREFAGANEAKDQLEQAIEGGFNQLTVTGKGNYDRTLGDLTTADGFDYGVEFTKQGLLRPSKMAVDDAAIAAAHNYNKFKELQGVVKAQEPSKQAQMMLQYALNFDDFKPADDSLFSPLDRNWQPEEVDTFSPLESIEYWWMTNKTAMSGLSAMIDEETGKKNLDATQQEFVQRIDPNLVVSLEQIDSASDALAWAGNNLVIQGPDFAILAASLAGGPVTAALGLGYTFLKSTGNVVAEQVDVHDKVDAGQALAVGTAITLIDRLGAKGIITPSDFLTGEGREKLVEGIAAKKGISIEAAKKEVDESSSSLLREITTDMNIGLDDIKANKEIALGVISRIASRTGQEALTEGSQELTQYLAINGVPQTAEEWKKMAIRLADSAAAGGVVGGAYSIPKTLSERAEIQDFRMSMELFTPELANEYSNLAFESMQEFDGKTVEKVVEEYKGQPTGDTLEQRAERGKRSYLARARDKMRRGEFSLTKSSLYNIFSSLLYKKDGSLNRGAVLLANIEGAFQSMAGGTMYNSLQSRLGQVSTEIPWLYNPKKHLGVTEEELNVILRELADNNLASPPSFTATQRKAAERIVADLARTNGVLNFWGGFSAQQIETNPDLSSLRLLKKSVPSVIAIRNNPQAFIEKLSKVVVNSGYDGLPPGTVLGRRRAAELTNRLLAREDYNTLATEFKLLQLGDEFKEFYGSTPVENLMDKIVDEVTYATHVQYRGRKNEVITNIINELVDDDVISSERADELAADMIDQIDKGNNIFGRGSNAMLRKAIDHTRVATTIGVMDYSVFAQAAEAVFGMIGTNESLLKATVKIAQNLARSVASNFKVLNDTTEEYRNLGYNSEETTQQQGAAIDDRIAAKVNSFYFKLILTAPVTDAIRMTRMGAAAGVIENMVITIKDMTPEQFAAPTKGQMEIIERLSFYGGDPKELVRIYNSLQTLDLKTFEITDPDNIPADLERLHEIWEDMIPKFIDEAIVRTKPGSRPGIFEDKRYGIPLFTQFLSFVSHWSANQLPRFYNVYFNNGGKMAYDAFATAMSAILAAYIAQFMKDWLKNGEESPYLHDFGAAHRAFTYSGLLGWSAEAEGRLVSGPFGFGALKQYFDGDATGSEAILGIVEPPAISHLSRVGKDIYLGNYKEAAERAMPLTELARFFDGTEEEN